MNKHLEKETKMISILKSTLIPCILIYLALACCLRV